MRGLFVTGTDTGVGKTVVSAALIAAMRAAGARPHAYKPVVTGLDDPSPAGSEVWPADHELLGMAAGADAALVSPISFGPAVSPQLAAELAGERITSARLLEGAQVAASTGPPGPLVVEGVGGLLAPLNDEWTVCDLAAALGLPALIVARPGLGTINHTLLTLRAARDAGVEVRAVVLTPWPAAPGRLEQSNRKTIARMGAVEVVTLDRVSAPEVSELARAGSTLPWERWLAGPAA